MHCPPPPLPLLPPSPLLPPLPLPPPAPLVPPLALVPPESSELQLIKAKDSAIAEAKRRRMPTTISGFWMSLRRGTSRP